MSYNREMLRKEAMAIYKQEIKKVKRGQRISFAVFFKRYMEMKQQSTQPEAIPKTVVEDNKEDFDLENVLTVNNDA